MFDFDIKVHVPTPAISKLVQEKLFEMGFSWRYYGDGIFQTEKRYLYLCVNHKDITFGENSYYFHNLNHKQLHYLQILTGDLSGCLFKDLWEGSVYYQLGEMCYHINFADHLVCTEWDLDYQLKNGMNALINENEEEITMKHSNEMPDLIAGKHMILTEDGSKGLVLADNIALYFEGNSAMDFEATGWDYLEAYKIEAVYELHTKLHSLSFDVEDTNMLKLIWQRAPERTAAQKRYDEIQKQMVKLQSELDELGDEL